MTELTKLTEPMEVTELMELTELMEVTELMKPTELMEQMEGTELAKLTESENNKSEARVAQRNSTRAQMQAISKLLSVCSTNPLTGVLRRVLYGE